MRANTLILCLTGVFLLSFASYSDAAEMRTWTRKNGKTFEATFVKLEHRDDGKNMLTLRKSDGTEMTIGMGVLSEDDRKYVKQHSKSAKDAGDVKPPVTAPEKPVNKPDGEKRLAQPEESSSDQPKTVIVEAKGSGKDRNEALKDAFRDAVRKVVGAYVEEESVVKNDKLIEEVRTYSGGCVRNHGILSEYKDGSITIWALVEQDKVVKRLKAASVSLKAFPGVEILDRLMTTRAKEKAAEAMLRDVLKGFPANCVKAVVEGKPEEISHDDRSVTVQVKVRCGIDAESFAAFRQRLQAVLHAIAEKEEDGLWQLEKRTSGNESYYRARRLDNMAENKMVVVVNTHTTEQWDRMAWHSYVLDIKLASVFGDVASSTPSCKLSLVGSDGQLIYPDAFGFSHFCPAVEGVVYFSPLASPGKGSFCHLDQLQSVKGAVEQGRGFQWGISRTRPSSPSGIVALLDCYFYRGFINTGMTDTVPNVLFTRRIKLTDKQLESLQGGKVVCKIEFSDK